MIHRYTIIHFQLQRLTFWTRLSSLPNSNEGKIATIFENSSSSQPRGKINQFFSGTNFSGSKKLFFTLCGISKHDLEMKPTIESRNLSHQEEAEELARFLKEDPKSKRFVQTWAA